MCLSDNVFISFFLQVADDCAAYQATVACYVNFICFVHGWFEILSFIYVIAKLLFQWDELSNGTNLENINKKGARTAGAKVAPFLFIFSKFWVLDTVFAIGYYDFSSTVYLQ